LDDLADHGLPVLFVGGLPARSVDGSDATATLARLTAQISVYIVSLDELKRKNRSAWIWARFYETAQVWGNGANAASRYARLIDCRSDNGCALASIVFGSK
jgi:hypothetical protein